MAALVDRLADDFGCAADLLADALRQCLPHVDRARAASGGDGDIAAHEARNALQAYEVTANNPHAHDLAHAAAAALSDLDAMVAAADRGEVWTVNAGTRLRLDNLRAVLAGRPLPAPTPVAAISALTQIANLAEFNTTGANTDPACKADALTAGQATALRGAISAIARDGLAACGVSL